MITLGIETSCDETAVALFDSSKRLVGEAVFSQLELYGEYGCLTTALASCDPCQTTIPIYKPASRDIQSIELDHLAYTSGPR